MPNAVVVGALHLDIEPLARGGAGDGHREGRAVLAGTVGGAQDRRHIGGVDRHLGRQQAQPQALRRDFE